MPCRPAAEACFRIAAHCLRIACRALPGIALVVCVVPANAEQETPHQPNILLIVLDDLGYSDLGATGSEIPTPHLDKLVASGMLLTNFHVSPGCSPTRAMLMSGTDSHIAGVGSLQELTVDNQRGKPGYRGHLGREIIPMPQLLRDGGYRTYMTGKWHLGLADDLTPDARGFERSFAMLLGAASHFSDQSGMGPELAQAIYREDGVPVNVPQDFYSTYFYTDKLIEYLENGRSDTKPFFAYLAYTAPHWPLHAPDDWLAAMHGRYDEGYDVIRERRIRRMRSLGISDAEADAAERAPLVPPWSQLNSEQQADMARRMEVYAAMVAALDESIGRLVEYLGDTGQLDNTLILLFSDNGPDFSQQDKRGRIVSWIRERFDNSLENMGRIGSFISYGGGWAQAGAGPYRLFKGTMAQGGILSPLVAVYPGRVEPGSGSAAFASVMDILPTVLDAAGIAYPPSPDGGSGTKQRLRGSSLLPVLTGRSETIHGNDYVFAMELVDSRMLRLGDWKLLHVFKPFGPGRWQLYNIAHDPGETLDLAASEPQRLAQMTALYETWAAEAGVVEPEGGHPLTRAMLEPSKNQP